MISKIFKRKKPDAEEKSLTHVFDPRKNKALTGPDESNWLISYADIMTLLCSFFVMMFLLSKTSAEQAEKTKEEIVKQLGGSYVSPTLASAKFITQLIEDLGIQGSTIVTADPTGVAITFQSTAFFDTLSSALKPEGTRTLDLLTHKISDLQKRENKAYKIVVEGHTDSRPVISGIYPSNWELSSARAAQVIRLFQEHGFTKEQLLAIGYSDSRPLVPERLANGEWDESALAKNRRVVIRVLEPNVNTIAFNSASTAH